MLMKARLGNLYILVHLPLVQFLSFLPSFHEYLLCPRHREEAICIKEINGRKEDKAQGASHCLATSPVFAFILGFYPFL